MTIHNLPAEAELRLECNTKLNPATRVTLTSGSCELFGSELAQNHAYDVTAGSKLALFTWHGCTLTVSRSAASTSTLTSEDVHQMKKLNEDEDEAGVDHQYVSTETNANVAHVNTHAQLEALRDQAVLASAAAIIGNHNGSSVEQSTAGSSIKQGPRVLLAGPSDCGKSALQRVLISYAVKLGRSPLVVDLDSSQNCLSVPGTFAASAITSYDSVDVQSFANQGEIMPSTSPVVFWNGSTDITSNMALTKLQLTKLGNCINFRLKNDVDTRNAGCIVNTSGAWIEGDGYELLKHAIETLQIDVILVVGQDRLYSMLSAHCNSLANASTSTHDGVPISCKVIKLPVSGGVVTRDSSLRRDLNRSAIKSYFYGSALKNNEGNLVSQYTPYQHEIAFSDLRIFQLSGISLTSSMLPKFQQQATDPVQLNPVEISSTLKQSILAVCHPLAVEAFDQTDDNSKLYLSGIAGFVVVENVDIERNIVKLLSPCAGELPSMTLLMGEIKWTE